MAFTNMQPPILEKEDEVMDSRPLAFTGVEVSLLWEGEQDLNVISIGAEKDGVTKKEPTLGPERPLPDINDLSHFWLTYDKVSGAFDREFMDAWNKSLDVLLIFAGLFSAINTAFIIESYRGLQPDPAETTNALLRLFILHRNDNITLSAEELDLGSPASSAVAINSIFFSSLSFSLTAAFGAVTAKQWLTEYTNTGPTKPIHIQGRKRQEKYSGLEKWHLRLIIELLPMLLQISLVLFLVGVVHFLWTLDQEVTVIQLILSGLGIAIYFVTIVIGIISPTSPFRTPLTMYIPWYFTKARGGLRAFLSLLEFGGLIEPLRVMVGELGWINKMVSAFHKVHFASSLRSARTRGVSILRERMGYTNPNGNADSEPEDMERVAWDPEDIVAAESVVWLLEQAEHPDVTIIALDAVPRLPPDLIFHLVQKREGLLERLVEFHTSLLPPLQGSIKSTWMIDWPNRAIVSGVALWHILKVRGLIHDDIWAPLSHQGLLIEPTYEDFTTPINATKFYLTWNHLLYGWDIWRSYFRAVESFQPVPSSSTGPSQFLIELMDTRQASTINSFTTSISPFFLHLDALIHIACKDSLKNIDLPEDFASSHLHSLSSKMQGELSREVVSYIALATAALQWRFRVDGPWSYPSTIDQTKLESTLISRFYDLNKTETVQQNVGLALTLIDTSNLDVTILHTLFTVTETSPIGFGSAILLPKFPQCLLHLSRHFPDDDLLQFRIARTLRECPDGDWVSPLNQDCGGDIIKLLGLMLRSPDTDYLAAVLLNTISRVLDENQLLDIMNQGPMGLYQYHAVIASQMIFHNFIFAQGFAEAILKLDGSAHHRGLLLQVQITFVAAILSGDTWYTDWWEDALSLFFNRMLKNQTELYWPAYFISEGIISSNIHNSDDGISSPVKYIHPRDLKNCFAKATTDIDAYKAYVFRGEALVLLWRLGTQEHTNGGLSSDWNDDIFFERKTVDAMLDYYGAVKGMAHVGIDCGLLKEYFMSALDAPRVTEDLDHESQDSDEVIEASEGFGYERSQRRRRAELKIVLKTLNDDCRGIAIHSESDQPSL